MFCVIDMFAPIVLGVVRRAPKAGADLKDIDIFMLEDAPALKEVVACVYTDLRSGTLDILMADVFL